MLRPFYRNTQMNNKELIKALLDLGLAVPDTANPGKYKLNIGASSSGSAGGDLVANSALQKAVINENTQALADAALATWLTNNPNRTIVHMVPSISNDPDGARNTIIILHKAST